MTSPRSCPPDPFHLKRFVDAQAGTFERAKVELERGRKRSHWMWFMLPQLRGLGSSAMADEFGITGSAEARAYLAHPILGPRLIELTALAMRTEGKSAHDIFGSPDDLKFHSSLTLFALVADDDTPFRAALDRFFSGQLDAATVRLLSS